MEILNRLRDVTERLSVYDFGREPSVPAELYAYAAGLEKIAQKIDGALADLFPATAGEAGLRRFERLLHLLPEGEMAVRRQRICERMARRAGAWSRAEYFQEIEKSGFTGTWSEEPENFTLRFHFAQGATPQQMRDVFSASYRLLPAHLRPGADTRPLTWDQIDAAAMPFSHWDESCICWDAAGA